VDHVFFSSPRDQGAQQAAAAPDWTDVVYREVLQRVGQQLGTDSLRDLFAHFDADRCNYVTRVEFERALRGAGFGGEGTPALTTEEVQALIDSADKDGDGACMCVCV
jgi:Ca2+-binding EF-hand superfamily protein